ncbi:CapA family protein [Leucobacter allii]|uniref:CapA family protein n=1 Tax=Leucobacter allii TaxID=2932247 RepID=UPI001FD5DB26|nr:CapA family protein [Leucobacter allii]UOR02565.1 CapA family protein [Leucobacter allii]
MDDGIGTGRRARRGLPRRARLAITLGVAAALLLGGGIAAAAVWGGSGRDDGEARPAATPDPTESTGTAAASPDPSAEPAPETEDEAIRVIAMGDMLPHDSVNANALGADGGYDYGQFFAGLAPQLADADVTFCNQEVPSAGVDFGISGYPTFNAPAEFARDLHEVVGCDLVNTATNHTADQGVEGIAATRAVWDGLGPVAVAGANRSAEEQRTVPVFEQGGASFALVSFAEYSNAPIDGVSLNLMEDDALVSELMAQAREVADVVIVSAHWGTEDSHEVNDQQRAFAQRVADLGADVILGTGPHVLQPAAWLDRADGGRTLVWYSLGNMLNTQLGLDQLTGVIAGFDVVPDGAGDYAIERPTGILTYMHYDWSAEEEAAGDLLARRNLSLGPLAGAGERLASTRFGVTPEQQIEASAAILGPDVEILAE